MKDIKITGGDSLREELADWTDIDVAGFVLARRLGIIGADVQFQTHAKHVFWSEHPVGRALYRILDELVEAGVLEKRDEPDFQYRWNPAFKGSWERSG